MKDGLPIPPIKSRPKKKPAKVNLIDAYKKAVRKMDGSQIIEPDKPLFDRKEVKK